MILFNQLVTEPSDALVREAQQHSVTALEWNKHRLFSGFSSGKVLMTTMKLNKVTIDCHLLGSFSYHFTSILFNKASFVYSIVKDSICIILYNGKFARKKTFVISE